MEPIIHTGGEVFAHARLAELENEPTRWFVVLRYADLQSLDQPNIKDLKQLEWAIFTRDRGPFHAQQKIRDRMRSEGPLLIAGIEIDGLGGLPPEDKVLSESELNAEVARWP